jgi:hypothetical protein
MTSNRLINDLSFESVTNCRKNLLTIFIQMIRINFVLFPFTASQLLLDIPLTGWVKGDVMGKPYSVQREGTAAHLPVLQVHNNSILSEETE